MTYASPSLPAFLRERPSGEVAGADALQLAEWLSSEWESFDGTDETAMAAHKIVGRAYNFTWQKPFLSFEIERHGSTVLGSTRAQRQRWTLDVDRRTASSSIVGFRQLEPRAASFKPKPVVDQFLDVVSRKAKPPTGWKLTWLSESEIRIVMKSLLPDQTGFKQTLQSRGKRLRKLLAVGMSEKGWRVSGDSGAYLRFKRNDAP